MKEKFHRINPLYEKTLKPNKSHTNRIIQIVPCKTGLKKTKTDIFDFNYIIMIKCEIFLWFTFQTIIVVLALFLFKFVIEYFKRGSWGGRESCR